MAPPPPRIPSQRESNRSARGSSGSSALSQLTNAVIGSLYVHKGSKSTRALKPLKAGGKVFADNRSPSRRSQRRTSGRNGDLAVGDAAADALKSKKISIRERGDGAVESSDGTVAIGIVGDGSNGTAPSLAAVKRAPNIGSMQVDGGFSSSFNSIKSKLLGATPKQGSLTKIHGARKDPLRAGFDYVDDDLEMDDMNELFDADDDDDDGMEDQRRAFGEAEEDEVAYFSQRGSSFDLKVGRRIVLHPYGRARAAWDCFLFLMISWMLFSTPFELSFRELSAKTRRSILEIDYFLDVMFTCDIILNFMTAVEFDGRLHFSYRSIRRHYLRGWFLLDTLWTVPFYAMTGSSGAKIPEFMSFGDLFQSDLYPILRIFRLARILSATRIRQRLEFSLRISSSSSSLGGFVYTVMGLSHLLSCMFAYLAFGDEYHLNVALADRQLEDDSIYSKYIASSYWAMMTIATVGYGDITVKTNAGRVFSIVAMVMGGGIFAYGISNVVDLFQQLYIEETEYRHKMDQVNNLMHYRNLPRKLRDEIRANFFHLRKATRENKTQDFAVVQQMSRTMQSRVADHFCLDWMPDNMPTLAGCNAEFIHELYLAMEVQCYLPGEDIIRQDDFGSEIYFLFVGHVQVFVGHTKVALFGPNSCFGEFALMNPRRPRLATIQAVDFCETHCIMRHQLLTILLRHPFMLNSIKQLVQLRQRKALAVLTDQTTRSRTLIQSLAAVWYNEGLPALLPPGVKIEDRPDLQCYIATPSSTHHSGLGSRLMSVRGGLATARRKSISPAMSVEHSLGMAAGAAVASAVDLSAASAQFRRRKSSQDLDVNAASGEAAPSSAPPPMSGATTARVRRPLSRGNDSGSTNNNTVAGSGGGDERFGLLLHQVSVMLKRQEKLEQQMQQLLSTRQHRGSVHVSFPTAAAEEMGTRRRSLVTDFTKAYEAPM